MITKIELLNQAVSSLSRSSLVISDDPNTEDPITRSAVLAFDSAVNTLNARLTWTFLTRQKRLQNPVKVTHPEFKYAYAYPEDFDRVIAGLSSLYDGSLYLFSLDTFLQNAGHTIISGYSMDGKHILTNYDPLVLVYQAKDEDSILRAPSYYISALVAGIRKHCSLSILNSPLVHKMYAGEFEQESRVAMQADFAQAQRFYNTYSNHNDYRGKN